MGEGREVSASDAELLPRHRGGRLALFPVAATAGGERFLGFLQFLLGALQPVFEGCPIGAERIALVLKVTHLPCGCVPPTAARFG